MDQLDAHILGQILAGPIGRVSFRKDADAADLLIADIAVSGQIWTINEDFSGWPQVVEALEELDEFPTDWRERAAGLGDGERWEAWGRTADS